jgi:SPP1 family predicted phage head-tail adaptor
MLTEPVTFQRPVKTSDSKGGYTTAFAAVASAPTVGHVKATSGGERWANSRTEATSKYKLTVRYFSGLKESDAVTIRNRRHNIQFINNLEFMDQWLEIDLDLGVAT